MSAAIRWVRLPEIAQHCGLSTHSIYKLVHADVMPHGRAGRILVFDVEAVDEWLRSRGSSGRLDSPVSEERAQRQALDQQVAQISDEILASA